MRADRERLDREYRLALQMDDDPVGADLAYYRSKLSLGEKKAKQNPPPGSEEGCSDELKEMERLEVVFEQMEREDSA